MWIVKKAFDDKRATTGLLVGWMLTVCTIFYSLGAFHMGYMHVGPGKDTVFMGLQIDTWGKWSALAIFSFCNTCINEFISNALDPWFINTLQDHKTRHIQYSHATCLWIVQIHCMYGHVMSVFALFLFFSQVDFAIIRLIADWIVTGFSTVWFIQGKVYDPSYAKPAQNGALRECECMVAAAAADDDDDEGQHSRRAVIDNDDDMLADIIMEETVNQSDDDGTRRGGPFRPRVGACSKNTIKKTVTAAATAAASVAAASFQQARVRYERCSNVPPSADCVSAPSHTGGKRVDSRD
jgi:hypothetical protein